MNATNKNPAIETPASWDPSIDLTNRKRRPAKKTSGFACMECGHKFRTVAAAERASFGPNGCPKCGGSDIDLA